MLIVVIQKSAEACTICGKVVSRASDITCHMRLHDPTKFVPLFSNLLIVIIDAYFVGNSYVLGTAVASGPTIR